jgi:hypothetical protein
MSTGHKSPFSLGSRWADESDSDTATGQPVVQSTEPVVPTPLVPEPPASKPEGEMEGVERGEPGGEMDGVEQGNPEVGMSEAESERPVIEEGDDDAMEGIEEEGVKYEEVCLAHVDLDDQAQKCVLEHQAHLYPDTFYSGHIDENTAFTRVPSADVFAFRGQDSKFGIMPDGLGQGQHIRTIVLAGKLSAGKHLDTSIETARTRDGDKPQQGTKPKGKQPKGKQPTSKPTAIPVNECVKVKFHLDTQTPHIELLTYEHHAEPRKQRVFSCRLFAQDISMQKTADQCLAHFDVEKYVPNSSVDTTQPGDVPASEGAQVIEKMSSFQKTSLIRVTVGLDQVRQAHWDGITAPQLEAIRKNPDPKRERDNLIVLLDQSMEMELYFTCKSGEAYIKRWQDKFANYMRNLLTIAKVNGNFWFYRSQIWYPGDPRGDKLDNPLLEDRDWVIPRWLVKEWSFTKRTSAEGVVTWTKPRPSAWNTLNFPTSGYPNAKEAAFFLKMGVIEERARQLQDLRSLVQSDGTKWFKGRFRSLNEKKTCYAVEVYLGIEKEMAAEGVSMPKPGHRIHLEVDRVNGERPQAQNVAKMDGVVVFDALDTNASFICVVNVKGRNLHNLDTGLAYHMFVSYIVDDLPHRRMLDGIAQIQASSTNGVKFGPDPSVTILGCAAPSSNNAILKDETSAKDIEEVKKALQAIKPTSDESQIQATVNTCVSPSGNVVVVGPPGTGKTLTVAKTGYAHSILGRRVMFAAPMNSNVFTLLDKFMANNAQLPDEMQLQDHEWVYFTGGYTSIDKGQALSREQSSGHGAQSKANNKLMRYLHDANARAHIPRYDSTLGYKLAQRIAVWASDPKFDEDDNLHSRAKLYIKTKSSLARIEDKDERSRAKVHLRNAEYNFSVKFLSQVKVCFCTLSTSGHDLLKESGLWDLLLIDEAARETRIGLAVALGALVDRVKLILFAGDHHQGGPIIMSKGSNVAYDFLARSVFANLAEPSHQDEATPCEVVTLDTCRRMPQELIAWSSDWCYKSLVKSHSTVGTADTSLHNMLVHYWKGRVHDDYQGSFIQMGLDVTDLNIKDEISAGTTTRLNKHEALQIAATIIDMLATSPPSKPGLFVRRIRGADICVISNYTGQILEIQQAIRTLARQCNLEVSAEDLDDIWYKTTTNVQGDEREITFYSLVIAPGTIHLPMEESLPIGFVADLHNLNVSVTRCKVARYIYGALQLYVQLNKDKHPLSKAKRYLPFFDFIQRMHNAHSIIALEDSVRWFEKRLKPEQNDTFQKKLLEAARFLDEQEQKVDKAFTGLTKEKEGSDISYTVNNTNRRPPPKDVQFPGAPGTKNKSKNKDRVAKRRGPSKKDGNDRGGGSSAAQPAA